MLPMYPLQEFRVGDLFVQLLCHRLVFVHILVNIYGEKLANFCCLNTRVVCRMHQAKLRCFVLIDLPQSSDFCYGLDALNRRLWLPCYLPVYSLPMKLITTLPRFVDLWYRFVILWVGNIHDAGGNDRGPWQSLDASTATGRLDLIILSSVGN